ncbi:MAG: HAD family hydrolase [Treponema sp.]|nr:HAD family hydrolase [Treponema sp.]
MTHERRGRITAVAFDIDGTLYPQRALFWRMSGHFMRHCIFFLHYGIIRKQIRTLPVQDDFYRTQNELLAARLRCTPEDAQKKLREIVYDGLAPYFKRIKPFPGVLETFKAFYDAGLKLGVLSDFPPEQKGDLWGCRAYAAVVLSAEATGALKPAVHPFAVLAERLETPPEQILYVGNSVAYDVRGAHRAGFQTACIVPPGRAPVVEADFSFSTYRQLQQFVLK